MRMRSLAVSLLLLGVLAKGASAQQLSKEQIEKAKAHYLAGVDAEKKADYTAAVREFSAAYEITKDPKLFYQIAKAHELSGNLDEALLHYRRYLNEAKLSDAGKTEIEAKITELEEKRKTSPPPGGNDLLPPSGDTVPPGGGETPETPPTFIDSKPRWQRTAAWISVGVTAALLTTGGVLATSASSREEDLDRLTNFRDPVTGLPREYAGTIKEQYEEAYDEGDNLQSYSRIALIGAGVTAAAAITFFILDATRPVVIEETGEKEARVAPYIARDGAGIGARWDF